MKKIWGTLGTWVSSVLGVSSGGTGAATLADGGIVIGNGTGAVEVVTPGATTEILVGGGAATKPVWKTATGTGAPVRATSPIFEAGIGIGGATSGTGGVAFPATAVPVADVNTLDDYEEGTWTPDLQFNGAKVGVTYATQLGLYTKIGNLVFVTGYIQLTSKGSSAGDAHIYGLPATVKNSHGIAGNIGAFSGITFANQFTIYANTSDTKIILQECTEGGTRTVITNSDFSDTAYIQFSVFYHI